MNKKGNITDWMSDIVGFAAYLFVFIMFVLLFNLRIGWSPRAGDTVKMNILSDEQSHIDDSMFLLNLLRTETDGKNFKDIISDCEEKNDYKEFEEEMKTMLNRINNSISGNICMYTGVSIDNNHKSFVKSDSCPRNMPHVSTLPRNAEITIPLPSRRSAVVWGSFDAPLEYFTRGAYGGELG